MSNTDKRDLEIIEHLVRPDDSIRDPAKVLVAATMNRRNFLRGLLATAAIPVIGADLVVRTASPCNVLDMGGLQGTRSVWVVTWGEQTIFKQLHPNGWRYLEAQQSA